MSLDEAVQYEKYLQKKKINIEKCRYLFLSIPITVDSQA